MSDGPPPVMIGATYRHYKGGLYHVLMLGRHSETGEEVVVYRLVDESGPVWVRPLALWNNPVCVDGAMVVRFARTDGEG